VDGSKAVHIGDNYVSTFLFLFPLRPGGNRKKQDIACYICPVSPTLFTLQELDYLAARNAGMRSLLLVRNDKVCMW